jgi:hypothetical protein
MAIVTNIENSFIALRKQWCIKVFVSEVMRVVYSKVLTEINVNRQAEQAVMKRGLGVQGRYAYSDVLLCL